MKYHETKEICSSTCIMLISTFVLLYHKKVSQSLPAYGISLNFSWSPQQDTQGLSLECLHSLVEQEVLLLGHHISYSWQSWLSWKKIIDQQAGEWMIQRSTAGCCIQCVQWFNEAIKNILQAPTIMHIKQLEDKIPRQFNYYDKKLKTQFKQILFKRRHKQWNPKVYPS